MEPQVGDHIRIIAPDSYLDNLHGTILQIDAGPYNDNPFYLICFDETRPEFHDDENGNHEYRCLWVTNPSQLVIESPLSQFSENDFNNFIKGG